MSNLLDDVLWVLLDAVIAVFCGGYLGWLLSGGSILGGLIGILIVASVLYVPMVYDAIVDW